MQPLNVGFPVACLAGRATTAYHRVGVVGAEKEGSVSVAGPSAVRWSLTVGREGSGS